jgi:hypothetical protein
MKGIVLVRLRVRRMVSPRRRLQQMQGGVTETLAMETGMSAEKMAGAA